MSGWGEAFGAVLGWVSPAQREKAKRIKLKNLKDERARLEKKIPCTVADSKRVAQIDIEIDKITTDLIN